MKTVLNFSHPLRPDAVDKLREMMAVDIRVVDIRVQIDLHENVAVQVDDLVDLVLKNHSPFAAMVPPGLSAVAGPLVARLSYAQSDAMLPVPPDIVVMAQENGVTPPRFMPVEIMRW